MMNIQHDTRPVELLRPSEPSLLASLSAKLSTVRRPAARAAPGVACWGLARCSF